MKRNSSNNTVNTTSSVSNANAASKPRASKPTNKPSAPKEKEGKPSLTLASLTDEQRELGLALRYIMEHTEKDGNKVLALVKTADKAVIKAADGLDAKASKSATWSIRQSAMRLGGAYDKKDGSYTFGRKEFSEYITYYKLVKDISLEETTVETEEQTEEVSAEPMMTKSEAMARAAKVIRQMIGKKFVSDDTIKNIVSEAFAS